MEQVDGVELVPREDEITNADEPVAAVRSRPDASVVLAARDVAEGRSDAIASAGSTGATMTAALFALRRMQGVRRPALAVQLLVPGQSGPAHPAARRGCQRRGPGRSTWSSSRSWAPPSAKAVLGVAEPRVALLSVGEEAKKGSKRWSRPTHGWPGRAESTSRATSRDGDLLAGRADVIVTDGFTGNVVLKTIEGTADAVAGAVRDAARSGARAAAGGLLLRPALGGLRRQMDPDGTGGAILLGLRGVGGGRSRQLRARRGSQTRFGWPRARSRSGPSS